MHFKQRQKWKNSLGDIATKSTAPTWFSWLLFTIPDVEKKIAERSRIDQNSSEIYGFHELQVMHIYIYIYNLHVAISEPVRKYPPVLVFLWKEDFSYIHVAGTLRVYFFTEYICF